MSAAGSDWRKNFGTPIAECNLRVAELGIRGHEAKIARLELQEQTPIVVEAIEDSRRKIALYSEAKAARLQEAGAGA